MQEHRDLQKALRERNPEAAERFMREHLTRQFIALKSVYEGPSNPSAPETSRRPLKGK
jgi:DNA-binding GntR family transcriptional regulator